MLASYTAGVYKNAGGQECRVMRSCGGKDLRGSCCKRCGRAALVVIWPVGRRGIFMGSFIILVYDEGNDNVADDRKAVRDVLTVGSASA